MFVRGRGCICICIYMGKRGDACFVRMGSKSPEILKMIRLERARERERGRDREQKRKGVRVRVMRFSKGLVYVHNMNF